MEFKATHLMSYSTKNFSFSILLFQDSHEIFTSTEYYSQKIVSIKIFNSSCESTMACQQYHLQFV